jgi:hypothetical protein
MAVEIDLSRVLMYRRHSLEFLLLGLVSLATWVTVR